MRFIRGDRNATGIPSKEIMKKLFILLDSYNLKLIFERLELSIKTFDNLYKIWYNTLNKRAINSVGRVLPSHGRSREFESLIAYHAKGTPIGVPFAW